MATDLTARSGSFLDAVLIRQESFTRRIPRRLGKMTSHSPPKRRVPAQGDNENYPAPPQIIKRSTIRVPDSTPRRRDDCATWGSHVPATGQHSFKFDTVACHPEPGTLKKANFLKQSLNILKLATLQPSLDPRNSHVCPAGRSSKAAPLRPETIHTLSPANRILKKQMHWVFHAVQEPDGSNPDQQLSNTPYCTPLVRYRGGYTTQHTHMRRLDPVGEIQP